MSLDERYTSQIDFNGAALTDEEVGVVREILKPYKEMETNYEFKLNDSRNAMNITTDDPVITEMVRSDIEKALPGRNCFSTVPKSG